MLIQSQLPFVRPVALAWRIAGASFVHATRAWMVQVGQAMPILAISFSVVVVSLVWIAVDAVRAACVDAANAVVVGGLMAAIVLLAVLLRGYAPHMSEWRALPNGSRFIVIAEMLLVVVVSMPVLVVVAAGIVWAMHELPSVATAIRACGLLAGVISLSWSVMATRGWAAAIAVVVSAMPIVSLTQAGCWSTMLAMMPLLVVMPWLVARSAAQAGAQRASASMTSEHVLVHICMSRCGEMVLRAVLSLGILGWGAYWLSGWNPPERPTGLVLVSGLAALGCYGCMRIADEFKAERSELCAALPISGWRWAMMASAIPATLHLLSVLALGAALVAMGSSPAWIAAAAIVSVVSGLLGLAIVHVYPDNGMLVAASLPFVSTRLVGAIQS